jgi:hypothetical protein
MYQGGDGRLGALPRLLVGLHHRRRPRHADEHEVPDAGARRRAGGFGGGTQVDVDELSRLGGTRMRHAHEVHESVGRRNRRGVRAGVERITEHDLGRGRQAAGRGGTGQAAHAVPAVEERADQTAAHVPGATGDEHESSWPGRMPGRRAAAAGRHGILDVHVLQPVAHAPRVPGTDEAHLRDSGWRL